MENITPAGIVIRHFDAYVSFVSMCAEKEPDTTTTTTTTTTTNNNNNNNNKDF